MTTLEISSEQVAQYLSQNPDFLSQHPELAEVLTPPTRWSGDSVVDIQRFMVDRLKEELDGLRDCTAEVIETSRSNMSIQSRTHASVLAMLGAEDVLAFRRIITDELPELLDVDAAAIGLEPAAGRLLEADGICRLSEGEVGRLFGSDKQAVLVPHWCGSGALFGVNSDSVLSAALVRLELAAPAASGVLALGSAIDGMFHPSQGTELLHFLARVTEQCLQRLAADRR